MTKKIVIGLTALIAVVDTALILSGKDISISEYLYTTSREHPVIALVAGLLAGHIFWPVRTQK